MTPAFRKEAVILVLMDKSVLNLKRVWLYNKYQAKRKLKSHLSSKRGPVYLSISRWLGPDVMEPTQETNFSLQIKETQ